MNQPTVSTTTTQHGKATMALVYCEPSAQTVAALAAFERDVNRIAGARVGWTSSSASDTMIDLVAAERDELASSAA